MSTIETTGKTIEDAVRSGLVRLGRMKDEVDIEVLEEPKSGFFGFGSKPAKVRITEKEGVPTVPTRESQPAAVEKPVAPAAAEPAANAAEEAVPQVETEPAEAETGDDFTAEEAAAKAKAFLQEVLKNMGIDVVIEKMIKSDKVLLHLHGKNLGILIGKHGQTLDALQYLTNLAGNKGRKTWNRVILDAENYRERRRQTLERLAKNLADRVRRTHKKAMLEPMNPYERKIVHMSLQNDPAITTYSEGEEPYRKVVIDLK